MLVGVDLKVLSYFGFSAPAIYNCSCHVQEIKTDVGYIHPKRGTAYPLKITSHRA